MCGIAGIFRFDTDALVPEDLARLAGMAEIQQHRGPDARGQAAFGACALASQRLSILDLSPLGHMPMRSDDGRLALVQNGEIYNYVEIREELRALGHVFRSDGDTEVILRAFEQWGPACVERFVGMWTFALLDTRERTLFLSRDRLGVKPLYTYPTPGELVFASEIKAIVGYLRARGETVRANLGSIATYVATGLVDGLSETFFDGIQRFPPAAVRRVDSTGASRTTTYWDLPARAAAIAQTDTDGHGSSNGRGPWLALQDTLADAVRIHLRSDVPLGVCLSGGLDSSAIVGFAAQHVRPVKTFTVYFADGPDYDERQYARPIVQQFGAEAYERCIAPDHLLETLKRIVWHLDEPSLALGVFPQWHVMELAREAGVKVVLDGQGGDEIFAGYTNYAPQHLYGLLGTSPLRKFPVEAAALALNQGWPPARAAARSAVAMRLRRAPQPTVESTPDAVLLAPEVRLLADVSHAEWRHWPRVFDGWLTNVLYWELTRTRLPALLRYEDRLSMAFSIESRVPFLDHRLVELAFALPDDAKRRAGWSKYGLRRALDGFLPESVVWRRDKKGFPTPVGNWLRDQRGAAALGLLRDPSRRTRHLFPQKTLDSLAVEHVQRTADHAWQLWRALSTEVWLDAFELAP